MEEEKKNETNESKPISIDINAAAFISALITIGITILFAIIGMWTANVPGVNIAFSIIRILAYVVTLTLYVIPMFKNREIKFDATFVLVIIASLAMF